MVEIVLEVQKNDPSATTAILVRNRSHLHEIAPRLRNAGLRFRAIEIEGLAFRPVVQDLLALTRALIHPGDRLAWLALLRAPWCGLTLADIHALASMSANSVPSGPTVTVWELLNDDSCVANVSCRWPGAAGTHAGNPEVMLWIIATGKGCAKQSRQHGLRWAALLALIMRRTLKMPRRTLITSKLKRREVQGISELGVLEEGLARLYALPDLKADDTLQVMTIHKAKGLEFDHVILPGLGRSSRSNDKRLFMWMEHLRADLPSDETGDGDESIACADPGNRRGRDRIYAWLEKLEGEKEHLEDERLLYVGATRARKRLHLLGSTGYSAAPMAV